MGHVTMPFQRCVLPDEAESLLRETLTRLAGRLTAPASVSFIVEAYFKV
jgi:hypothetical protein